MSDAEGVHGIELNISCPEHQGRRHPVRLQPDRHARRRLGRAQGHEAADHSQAHAERHRCRVVRASGRRGRRRRRVARQHLPGDGHRRRNAAAEALERHGRTERSGDSADCRPHGLRVPAGGEDSGHRHGRHRRRARCARVHDRRRHGGSGRHRELRRPAHLVEARRRHRPSTYSVTASRASSIWWARSWRGRQALTAKVST